jgi:hypothetical protein
VLFKEMLLKLGAAMLFFMLFATTCYAKSEKFAQQLVSGKRKETKTLLDKNGISEKQSIKR